MWFHFIAMVYLFVLPRGLCRRFDFRFVLFTERARRRRFGRRERSESQRYTTNGTTLRERRSRFGSSWQLGIGLELGFGWGA